MTITAANLVIIMKAVGFCVDCLSHPVNGVSVVSTWTRSVLSTRRHSSSASNNTSPRVSIRSGFFSNRLEFIPIYGLRGLRGQEAPALAAGPCTGLQSCSPAFLASTRMTVDELQHLGQSFEAALHAQRACCYALHHCRMHRTRRPLIVESGYTHITTGTSSVGTNT